MQTVCTLMVGGGVHDEDGVRGESVSATTTTGQRRAYMRTDWLQPRSNLKPSHTSVQQVYSLQSTPHGAIS